jgi:hypothetical protein
MTAPLNIEGRYRKIEIKPQPFNFEKLWTGIALILIALLGFYAGYIVFRSEIVPRSYPISKVIYALDAERETWAEVQP